MARPSARVILEWRVRVQSPTKPAMRSNLRPAGYSALKPATLGVIRMGLQDGVFYCFAIRQNDCDR